MNGLNDYTALQTARNTSESNELIQNIENANNQVEVTDASISGNNTNNDSQQTNVTSNEVNNGTNSSPQTVTTSNKTIENKRTYTSNNIVEKQPLTEPQNNVLNNSIGNTYSKTSVSVQPEDDQIADINSSSNESIVSDLQFRGLNEVEISTSLLPLMDFSKQKLPARTSFYVNGFGGLSQSLITPSKDISTSFGLGIGAQIQKGRFTFTTGLNGVWSNHQDLNLSRTSKVYGFGSKEYNYQFKYKQIYLIEAELSAGYKMGKHLINVGVRPSMVIGTKVAVVQSVNEEKTIDRNEYGYVDGLNRFGIKPTIGYSFDITPSFRVGINVGLEMLSKIQEGYLVGSNNRFPVDGQLYLRKSIRFTR